MMKHAFQLPTPPAWRLLCSSSFRHKGIELEKAKGYPEAIRRLWADPMSRLWATIPL